MSRNRFSLLLRFLHLNDSTKYILNGEPGYDPLYKLRLSVDPFIVNFKAAFNLGHEIAVDEGMISFKGRLWFLQYMPKKTQPSEGWRHLYCQIALQDIPTIRNCIQVRTKISIWQTIPPLKMYVYFTHRKGLHTRWHEWCYTWCRPEANWRAWTQGTPCIHEQLLHKLYPIYLSATAWVWSVWYCSCQQARNSQWSHSSQAEGRDNYKWGEEGYACIQWQDKRAVVMLSTIHDDSRITKRRRTRLIAGGMEEIEKTTMVEIWSTTCIYMGRYGQGRSADVIPWIQPSYCQVLETCVSSSVWECHCECAHLVQTACTVIVHQGKSTKQPLEVWQRARKRNCWSGVAWHGSYEYLIFTFRGLKGVMDKYIYIFHTFNIVSSNTCFFFAGLY